MSEINENNISLDINEQVEQRKMKLAQLREVSNPYPNDFKRNAFAADVCAHYDDKSNEELEATPIEVSIAGRIMMRRLMGKASFIHIQDMTGQIQIYLRKESLPEGVFEEYKKWDIGDIVGAVGTLFKTHTGELSVRASELRLLTKSLFPLPDKFHGLTDIETRYRQRYLDLIMNEESRRVFEIRSKLISGIRRYLEKHRFLEVETPMMHPIPGGAAARPFVTYHNTLDMELFLRIAPELYLKRLVVGGFERVFEINRNFRNEGLSTRHNPEFTMIEFYQAYATFHDMMDLTEDMLRSLATEVLGTTTITYQNETFDFLKPFKRITVKDAILEFNPEISSEELEDMAALKKVAQRLNISLQDSYGKGKIWIEIFEKTVEMKLHAPTFITSYPIEVSPLARRNDENPFFADRFEFFVGGRELANGFSELNDPEDQAVRFLEQVKDKEAGDEEAMHFDQDYITALEHALPPTAGEGIGIDRLVMLFADQPSIRDVILFPHLRSRTK